MTLKHTARRRTAASAVGERTAPSAPAPVAPPVVPGAVARLLVLADAELAEAADASDPADRFLHAHLAALRSAAAVVELRGQPGPRSGVRTVWEMLAKVEPSLAAWSVYFASGARLRASVDAGHGEAVSAERAAELVACAEDFRDEAAMIVDPAAGFSRPLRWAATAAS
ncbi:colicin transporter [Xylanimonas allomyrinae]|uniref:Colicin transporter n=1 Tax=Xylanimonas allomyrinae TaxID=2509459 RepID=A0A4P6EWD7_9MICO|nr:SAV_6107 family HEPN domain-containing protein [Xylanimonas allomyrinae]QAY62328.1 colicin transporter [Xylanimonas allomyrinae]